MRLSQALLGLALLVTPSLAEDHNFSLSLNLPNYTPGEDIVFNIQGEPGLSGFMLFDTVLQPQEVLPGVTIDLALSSTFFMMPLTMPASGSVDLLCGLDCELAALIQSLGSYVHSQGVAMSPSTGELCVSNVVTVDASNTYGFCVPCDDCEGGVTSLTLRYTGDSAKYVEIKTWDNWNLETHFGQWLEPNEIFTVDAPQGGWGKTGTFNGYIKFYIDGWKQAWVKADCSEPIGPGAIYGDFRVLASTSKDGGDICPEGTTTPPGDGDDCTTGKPAKLVVKYTGGDCSDSDHDQVWDCACAGDTKGIGKLKLRAKDMQTGEYYFEGYIEIGETFEIDAAVLGNAKLGKGITIEMFDGYKHKWDYKWLATVNFDTTCDQPLAVGDVFGPIEIVSFIQ